MASYNAFCTDCGTATQAESAFDIIHIQKWKLELQRNRKGKIIATIWHCALCKKGRRHSQAPHA